MTEKKKSLEEVMKEFDELDFDSTKELICNESVLIKESEEEDLNSLETVKSVEDIVQTVSEKIKKQVLPHLMEDAHNIQIAKLNILNIISSFTREGNIPDIKSSTQLNEYLKLLNNIEKSFDNTIRVGLLKFDNTVKKQSWDK